MEDNEYLTCNLIRQGRDICQTRASTEADVDAEDPTEIDDGDSNKFDAYSLLFCLLQAS